MDWPKIIEGLGTLSSGALVALVVLGMLWFRSREKKKNGNGDELKEAIAKQGKLIKDLHQVRLRDRTPFQAATEDAAADAAIHKGHAHSKITSRETKHTRKLQAETARAAGVSDSRIKEIAAEIDNDKTGEFRAIDNGDPILEQDKS